MTLLCDDPSSKLNRLKSERPNPCGLFSLGGVGIGRTIFLPVRCTSREARFLRPTSYFLFILPSAQRFFMASDSRLLPSGVSAPDLRFLDVLPLGLPTRLLTRCDEADPRSAVMARPSRSRSFCKSEISFARSKFAFSFVRYHDLDWPLRY